MVVIALAVGSLQFYLARFSSRQSSLMATVIAVAAIALMLGYALFLIRARIAISDAEVTAHDLLGRETFRARRGDVHLRLVAVNDLGIHDEFGVLWAKTEAGRVSAVLLRRIAWGDGPLSDLRARLEGRRTELHFRPIAKGDLLKEFPRLYIQNLPAIAVVVIVVLVLALLINR